MIAIGMVFYHNLAYNYEMQGDSVDLGEYYTAAYGYDVSQAEGGSSFTVTGEDPQFILGLAGGTHSIGGIRLVFGSRQTQAEDLPVQVFYAKDGEDFKEKNSVKSTLKAGQDELLLPIPLGTYQTLRFDIDGDFVLAGIIGCTDEMKATAYISKDTVHNCLWYIPAVIIGFCLIYWAHGTQMKKGAYDARGYLEYVLLGTKPTLGREAHLDYMRVLAAVLVILAHACSPMVAEADAGWKRFVLVCGLSLGLCCNLLYVMLSGTLLLSIKNKKEESVVSFYIKRASKVIIPLIAYYLLLLSLNGEVSFLPPKNLGAALKRIVTGAPDAGPHLWLIYTIVSLYLVTPFFRVMVQHLSDKLLFSLAAVILVLNLLATYLPLFGMAFGAASFISGWEGVFLLGYILTRQNALPNAPKRNNWMLFAAVVSYFAMVAVVFIDSAYMNYVYNSAPTIVIASCGIFVLFMKNKERFCGKLNPLIRLFSKYSYSIILIHWYALFVVVGGKLHVTALRFGCIGGIAATVVLTLFVCLVMAVVFDNTVVVVCNTIFDKLTLQSAKTEL